jgi:hypothetical protein
MYKVASDKRQRGLHHGRPSDWVNGTEKMSTEDQYRQLKEGIRIIDRRILESTGKERKKLALQKADMQDEIVAFKEKHGLKKKQMEGLPQYIADCAKEMLPKIQYEMILNAAKRAFEKDDR